MVAMGSSLADRAWGRESAVYRVAGVMNVIAGWLITAVIAFSASALLAFVMYKTGVAGIFVLVGLAAFLLIRSQVIFSRRRKKEIDGLTFDSKSEKLAQLLEESKASTIKTMKLAIRVCGTCTEALATEKPGVISRSLEKIQELQLANEKGQQRIIKQIRKMPKQNVGASRLYIVLFDSMQDMYQSVQLISDSCIEHLKNFHSQPSHEFLKTGFEIEKGLLSFATPVCQDIESGVFQNFERSEERYRILIQQINTSIDRSIAEIQNDDIGNRIGMLQIKLLLETSDLLDTIRKIYLLYSDYHKQMR
jgi:hypothetical protein